MLKKLFGSDKQDPPRRSAAAAAAARKVSERPREKRTESNRQHRVRLPVKDLRVGMFVVELDKPWEESGFMLQGLDIKSSNEILQLQQECEFVYVDYDELSLKSAKKPEANEVAAGNTNSEALVSVEEEYGAAAGMHKMASKTVSTLFEEMRQGAEVDSGKVKAAVDGCVDSIVRNPDASVWLTRIQAKDEGTAQHSLNVAALSIVLGRTLKMTTKELEDLGLCAMLHDIGKTSVPIELLRKTTALTEEEKKIMASHCRAGRDLLVSTKTVSTGAADVAYTHHERPDGKGYPRGLTAEKIPRYSKIVAIAEAYDTITTTQPYREALSASQALQELYKHRGTQFDEDLVVSFIDSIGNFTPGSIVEMIKGEIGIVLSNTTDRQRPKVIMILNAIKDAAQQIVVDLSQMDVDSQNNVYQIKTTLPDGSYGINVEEFQRAGLRVG